VSDLTSTSSVDEDPASFVRRCGTVLREFDHHTQDSGNVSWLVESAGQRYFVKTAGTSDRPPQGAPVPGWIAGDQYDGCLIVDFDAPALRVLDLDSYRRGRTINDMGRMFGSTRFMAPEEFELGAQIDERTTVFTLGRIVWHFATRLTEDPARFCGTAELASVVQKATRASPTDRHENVAHLASAWATALRS
jgi:hypothetical protein